MAEIKTIQTTDVKRTVVSGVNELIAQDWKRWAHNAFVFSSGSILVFLIALQSGATLQQALVALYGAIINAVIDLIKKYQAEIKYVPEK